jgi:hypothetical protein
MNLLGRLTLTASGLGLLFLTAAPSFATVVDNLAQGHASITATPRGVTFTETYVGGPSTPTSGFSHDLLMPQGESGASLTAPPSSPDASNTDCMLVKIGQSCSIEIGSLPFPIMLTYLGPGTDGSDGSGKSELLGIGGIGRNGTWTDDVASLFVNENSGHTSMGFVDPGICVTPTDAAPEPRSVSAIAVAGLLIGIVVMKRRREASESRVSN